MKRTAYIDLLMLLSFLLMTFGYSACSEAPQSNNTHVNPNNSANTMSTNSAKANLQDNLMINIDDALNKWSPEHNDYTSATSLKNMWVESGHHAWDYIPKGAENLISEIQVKDFFKDCEKARNLKVRMFDAGGEVQTVGNLYEELYYCDPNNRR